MDKLDLTSSRVLKGSMKFTPKIGKKDKAKKTKKVNKSAASSKRNSISTKKPLNEQQQNKKDVIEVEKKTVEINNENNKLENSSEVVNNNKSITVNTINNKKEISSIKNKESIEVVSNNVEKDSLNKNNNNKQDNVSSINKTQRKSSIGLKKKQEIITLEEDTISEISDSDYARKELNDSIEECMDEEVVHTQTKKDTIEKENEDETLVEEAENSDHSQEPSSELAEETLIEETQRVYETDEEIIKSIPSRKSSLIKKSNKEKFAVEIDNRNDKESSKSIYELLEQEEFNQSIDTEEYNKPINHDDAEIDKIVKEKVTKRKVGRPPKKPRGRKPNTAKKSVEVIVISDDEDDSNVNKSINKTEIKIENENDLPVKIKKEDEVEEIRVSKVSKKRNNRELEMEEDDHEVEDNEEVSTRKLKRSKTSRKTVNNAENDSDDNGNEEEVRAKKSKSTKSKASKISKSSKTSKTATRNSDTEAENSEEQEGSLETSTPKKKTRKRKTTSPSKKSPKKKKTHHHNDDGTSSEEESENIDISSRTIADIIDNYRGTEISTTQKEIYRLAALKRKATLDRKRGRLSTPEITTATVPEKKPIKDSPEKKKVYDPEKNKTAIQMRVVNGEIVIDQQSTLINHIDTTDEQLPMLKYDENNHITSASFKPKLKPLKWSKEETELFYKCLSIFGTNFSMLAIMFPSRNRKQLLNKYKNEEKINPGHVKYALKHKMALDPEFFEKYSGQNMMEIGREAVEKVRLIEEQRKKEDMELFNIKKKENDDDDVKKIIIKNENIYDNNDVKDIKPILAN